MIAASAGGVHALEVLAGELPADLSVPVLVILHVSPHHKSLLPEILARAGALSAAEASDGEPLRAGHIHVAAPDHHLLVSQNRLRVTRGPKENHFRPSADVLFRSAAYHFGERVIGVVLSGSLADGSSGLYSIKRMGGIAIIQDPEEALYKSMPLASLNRAAIDYALPAPEIGQLLGALAREPAGSA
ncbi:MAG TPA: chemotaxis protein CheB, partial [Burkholderiales bacterium]|nr:chemotaxis protein CheB [Burkholderiales bacterium]